jgi:hypothetical protein
MSLEYNSGYVILIRYIFCYFNNILELLEAIVELLTASVRNSGTLLAVHAIVIFLFLRDICQIDGEIKKILNEKNLQTMTFAGTGCQIAMSNRKCGK